ncbi:hypothetical protein DFH08DRAFT_803933 [Mycena albidolilacea]|uniref:Antifreeze protein n=1 Tax=Mycena albidolilacea TaxID=1033008 RepID=A0AAD7AB51_9AGAR|nr:hypothetical protein DFH08DRAFT_803933 [Mycena albidolilacea]
MQSTLVALLAVLAAGGSAAPLNSIFDRATCDVKTCVIALQPSFPTACDPAALQLGANTPLNTACLVAAAKGTAAFPTACAPCAAQFGVTDPGNKSKTATNGATRNATPANGGKATIATPKMARPTVRVRLATSRPVSWLSSRPSLRARRPLSSWELVRLVLKSRHLVQHRVPRRGRQGYRSLPLRLRRMCGVTAPGARAEAVAIN